jgi:adenylate cyclase
MKTFKNRKLKIDMLAAFSFLISIAVGCEIFYSSYANKKLFLGFEKDYYSKNVTQTAAQWLDEYFEKLEVMLEVLSKNFSIDNDNEVSKYEILFLETLKHIPHTQSFYIAFRNGTYLQARTLDNISNFQIDKDKKLPSYAKYAVRYMQYDDPENPKHVGETWKYLNEDYGEVASEHLNDARYSAMKRDWYVNAELARTKTWSDVYMFKTVKTVGITLSIPIGYYEDSNTAIGVIAVDFIIDQFKGMLEKIKASTHSINYLVNEKNEVIATSGDMKTFTVSDEDGQLQFLTAVESGDPILESASKQLTGNAEHHVAFSVDGVSYVASIQKLKRLPYSLLTISPQNDFTGEFSDIQRDMLVLSIFIFLLSFGIVFILARRISDPITSVCRAAEAIERMDLENYKSPVHSGILEIQELANAMDSMKLSVSTFTKYAPKDLVRKLVQQGTVPTLGGETKKITLLFSDIENFSTISERLPAEYLTLHLSEYFDEITKEIMKYEGVIDKYIGDSVMAMWGAPNSDENQVVNACHAALACQELLLSLENKWAPLGKPALPTRIGVHTGQAIVGNIGSHDRMNFTSIGDSVNIASRLEGANKHYGTNILVSEDVQNEARGKILFRVIDKIVVKGKSSGIVVYEPLCIMGNAEDKKYYELIELSAKANEAFELYQNEDFERAIVKYRRIIELCPNTQLSIAPIIDRCKEFMKNPPIDWNGASFLHRK